MIKNNYCVIMAGGVGSRFWPMSRNRKPKQFLDILGVGKTFLQMTADRFLQTVPKENIYVVTNEIYRELTKEQLPFLKDSQILLEPARRNTAPCIAYATYKIHAINKDANIVVTPSDHLITNEIEFINTIKKGLEFTASVDALLTLGITPSRPETGYGYIQESTNKLTNYANVTQVKTFTEKPDLELARVFLDSGDFLWNSGIFIWNAETILKAFKIHEPELNAQFQGGLNAYNTPQEQQFINDIYPSCKSISIDYAILEKSENVFTMRSDFGWSDMGTWGSLYQYGAKDDDGNTMNKEVGIFRYHCENNLVSIPHNKVAILQGLKNYIVVDTPDALLVCKRKEEQRIRAFVEEMKDKTGDQFI